MDFASGVEIGLLGVWSVGEVGGGGCWLRSRVNPQVLNGYLSSPVGNPNYFINAWGLYISKSHSKIVMHVNYG